ncbi:hypothetical protein GCM10009076_28150 [Erythrobacter ramosus]
MLAAGCTATPNAPAPQSMPTLDSHVAGFAMAYCLRTLSNKGLPERDAQVLREQGERWNQVVVEQSRGDITLFFAMMPVIDAAIAATPMAQVKDEANAGSLPAPVFYCAEILRHPAVSQTMADARTSLAAAYAGDQR